VVLDRNDSRTNPFDGFSGKALFMKKKNGSIFGLCVTLGILISLLVLPVQAASSPQDEPPMDTFDSEPDEGGLYVAESIDAYFSVEQYTLEDGQVLEKHIINGPPQPPPEYEEERAASIMALPSRGVISSFPAYDWVFGCSAVSGAMIAAYYDRGAYPDIYTGPSNEGVMPISDTAWGNWSDGYVSYPNNPLIASRNGVDGRTTRGSIEDYWVKAGSTAPDPYISNGWPEHAWGSAIGDYMKTSQSAWPYGNPDGATTFWNYGDATPFTCSEMAIRTAPDGNYKISQTDGTYGRKLFYEARGYTVTDCYNQRTDVLGGFSLADFQAEIDAGHPVLLNLRGHSIVGYGYSGSTIYIRDTWDSDPNKTYTMTWGGSYAGMALQSVSIVRLGLPSPPDKPTGVTASDGTFADKVRVTWGEVLELNFRIFLPLVLYNGGNPGPMPEAPTYQVFRHTRNDPSVAISLTENHPGSPYDDTSAEPGTTYYYWVKACNSAGCSDFSEPDTGKASK
jgi:hypothetical protein